MNELTLQTEVARPKRRRLRFGMRGLIAAVLVLGLVFGGIARMERQVRAREALVAELARDGIVVVDHQPTYLCLIMMKVLSTHSRDVEARCGQWIGPGWFYYPRSFNAGHLKDEKVARVVELIETTGRGARGPVPRAARSMVCACFISETSPIVTSGRTETRARSRRTRRTKDERRAAERAAVSFDRSLSHQFLISPALPARMLAVARLNDDLLVGLDGLDLVGSAGRTFRLRGGARVIGWLRRLPQDSGGQGRTQPDTEGLFS